MSEPAQPNPDIVSLCSATMRAPYIFEQYNTPVKKGAPKEPNIEGLTRDLAIYLAWNGAEDVRLNAREFGRLFGYSHAYLFKQLTPLQEAWLIQKEFNLTDFKDLITFALAKLYIEVANFPEGAPFFMPTLDASTMQVNGWDMVYEGLAFIGKIFISRSRQGTFYTFRQHRAFVINCSRRFQQFDLNEYLALVDKSGKGEGKGRAWSSARRLFLHLAWKRGVWDEATRKGKDEGHEKAQLIELVRVAGIHYADQARQLHELRQLLKMLSKLSSISMSAVIKQNGFGQHEVTFTRLTGEKPTRKKRVTEPAN